MTATNKVGSGASMSVSSVGQKRLVIVGATGMVGGYAVRYALDNPAVKSVTSIGRKKLGILHPKLKEVCIKTSRTVQRSRMHFRARTRRCIAWARTPVRCQMRNFAP